MLLPIDCHFLLRSISIQLELSLLCKLILNLFSEHYLSECCAKRPKRHSTIQSSQFQWKTLRLSKLVCDNCTNEKVVDIVMLPIWFQSAPNCVFFYVGKKYMRILKIVITTAEDSYTHTRDIKIARHFIVSNANTSWRASHKTDCNSFLFRFLFFWQEKTMCKCHLHSSANITLNSGSNFSKWNELCLTN